MNKKETCFGIIPITKIGPSYHVLLVKHANGDFWGFPKGHALPNEKPKETAARELLEETNTNICDWIDAPAITETYTFSRGNHQIEKTVTYFLATTSDTVSIDHTELLDYAWVPTEQVHTMLTFNEAKNTWYLALEHLKKYRKKS